MNEIDDELLTTHDVARIFKVKARTIWDWIRTGKIIAYKPGHWRFRRSDVERVLLAAERNGKNKAAKGGGTPRKPARSRQK